MIDGRKCIFHFIPQSPTHNGQHQLTVERIAELSTCMQLISTLLTSVTALIERQIEPVQFARLGNFPLLCMQYLGQIFNVLSNVDDVKLQTLAKCAQNAHKLLLVLLTSEKLTIDASTHHLAQMEQSKFDCQFAFSTINFSDSIFFLVLLSVCMLAKIQTNLDDMKLMADTWKCFMKLTVGFASVYSQNRTHCAPNDDNHEATLKWFDESVEFICTHLQKIFNELRENCCDDTIINRNTKISLFFAKILQKLFSDWAAHIHRNSRHFIRALRTFYEIKFVFICLRLNIWLSNLSIYSAEVTNQMSALNALILATLNLIVWHKANAQLTGISRGNICICIEIAKILLKTTKHDDLFLSAAHAQNVLHFFVFKCGAEAATFLLTNPQMYEEIVFHSAALMISRQGDQYKTTTLERILAAAIVQENIHVGYLALDIWTLYLR